MTRFPKLAANYIRRAPLGLKLNRNFGERGGGSDFGLKF